MTDIVERLQRKVFRGPTMEAVHTKTLEWEAADEIERQREWNREIAINAKAYANEAANLRAQNAELVAALRGVLKCPHIAERDLDAAWVEPETEAAIAAARAALASIETPTASAAEAQDD